MSLKATLEHSLMRGFGALVEEGKILQSQMVDILWEVQGVLSQFNDDMVRERAGWGTNIKMVDGEMVVTRYYSGQSPEANPFHSEMKKRTDELKADIVKASIDNQLPPVSTSWYVTQNDKDRK